MFNENLRAMRVKRDFSQTEMAARLFISQQAYAKYELGTSSPNPETLAKIADILEVSVDYLLGKDTTQGMINYELFPVKAAIFSPIKSGDITKEDFCRQVGISDYTLYQWRNNGSTSYLDKLPEIAGALGVSVDKLLGKSFSSEDQRNSYILSLKHFQSQADEAFPELFGSSKMTITVTAEEFSLIEAYRTKSDEIKAAARGLLGVTAVGKD